LPPDGVRVGWAARQNDRSCGNAGRLFVASGRYWPKSEWNFYYEGNPYLCS
jgi:hypothetical protein